jgi:hypothetical protein
MDRTAPTSPASPHQLPTAFPYNCPTQTPTPNPALPRQFAASKTVIMAAPPPRSRSPPLDVLHDDDGETEAILAADVKTGLRLCVEVAADVLKGVVGATFDTLHRPIGDAIEAALRAICADHLRMAVADWAAVFPLGPHGRMDGPRLAFLTVQPAASRMAAFYEAAVECSDQQAAMLTRAIHAQGACLELQLGAGLAAYAVPLQPGEACADALYFIEVTPSDAQQWSSSKLAE